MDETRPFDVSQAWRQLVAPVDMTPDLGERYLAQLLAAYSEPWRAYHQLPHLQHLLGLMRESGVDDPACYWAAFYHDYVYLPGRRDNEARSAAIATSQLTELGVAPASIKRVEQLILATQCHQWSGADSQGARFLDADMAILGAPEVVYRQYQQQVRIEFKKIPGFLFKRGRHQFLRGLLTQQRIFISDWFYQRFEKQARININNELNGL